MDKATRRMLNGGEQAIIRLIESKGFAQLDEDQLLELHGRTRRARNKYSKLVRRRGAAKVKKTGSRAIATKTTGRTAAKAELFEDALATVSARLAKVAAASARDLRAARLAAARAGKKATGDKEATAKKAKGRQAAKAKKAAKRGAKKPAKTPASKRTRAATRARNQRQQAKRDKR
jgi:hypothetical protein